MAVLRVYVEKKSGYDIEAAGLLSEIRGFLNISSVAAVRLFCRYDVEGVEAAVFEAAIPTVFSEPPVDTVHRELPTPAGPHRMLAVEYLPGQYDQRADSAAQCIQILTTGERPAVASAKVYLLEGDLTDEEFDRIRSHLINPIESRESALTLPDTLALTLEEPEDESILRDLIPAGPDELRELLHRYSLAMDLDDLQCVQDYFRSEQRDPTLTELRLLDTYWSDHCRHTTFHTRLEEIEIRPPMVRRAYDHYLEQRAALGRADRPVTLMELATVGARLLERQGLLKNVDESEEVNACTVKIKADFPQGPRDYLLLFKNETHNHPTEIEPFGGAATCLGGAIRDPLSGRAYAYHAMRVTGSADPRTPADQTLHGKLPQKTITTSATAGYSSYGNQIGLTTGFVDEVYHPGYVAKRMECGAVLAAAPAENVVRQQPQPGDVVLLLGGRTGRDGLGGATGSSKSHTAASLTDCGAEVQKGNAPEERKIQRLFRNPDCTRLIKRCNDFGAGGASVAIGELCDGVLITLDAIPKKYEGLGGMELALSESQERMACVVAAADAEAFAEMAAKENLEATVVAVVTEEPRLRMQYKGELIVDLARDFLNSSGAPKSADVFVEETLPLPAGYETSEGDNLRRYTRLLGDLNVCSRRGMLERFDSSVGASTLLMLQGGKTQTTQPQVMAAKLPSDTGDCQTASVMSYGLNPYLADASPFHGAAWAVSQSLCRLVAAGGDRKTAYLTFQEFFEKMRSEQAFGKPFAALLGAYEAQLGLGVGAIGGKDSMSGTFEEIHVPPTLISFAVCTVPAKQVISPEFKRAGETVTLLRPPLDGDGLPDYRALCEQLDLVTSLCEQGRVSGAFAVGMGGVAEGIAKMAFGNRLGFVYDTAFEQSNDLFADVWGGILLTGVDLPGELVGKVTEQQAIVLADGSLDLEQLQEAWQAPLADIFPTRAPEFPAPPRYTHSERLAVAPAIKVAKPRVVITVFPGTNSEYDAAQAFERVGAVCDTFVLRNLTADALSESLLEFERMIKNSQIIMIPGGFSCGDEPDGSGKFIANVFRNPRIKEATHELLKQRDGLMLGICNGFQALIKTGLVPYGEIRDMTEDSATLTANAIGRHQNRMVTTRVASVLSPWMAKVEVDQQYTIPLSHGEGRVVASDALLAQLAQNGQIATQYVDFEGNPSMDVTVTPNSSVHAIEGITSPDGRVFGKMAHVERVAEHTMRNIPGVVEMPLLAGGVSYFS